MPMLYPPVQTTAFRLPPAAQTQPASNVALRLPASLVRPTQRAMLRLDTYALVVGPRWIVGFHTGTCVGLAWAQVESPTENPGKLSQIRADGPAGR